MMFEEVARKTPVFNEKVWKALEKGENEVKQCVQRTNQALALNINQRGYFLKDIEGSMFINASKNTFSCDQNLLSVTSAGVKSRIRSGRKPIDKSTINEYLRTFLAVHDAEQLTTSRKPKVVEKDSHVKILDVYDPISNDVMKKPLKITIVRGKSMDGHALSPLTPTIIEGEQDLRSSQDLNLDQFLRPYKQVNETIVMTPITKEMRIMTPLTLSPRKHEGFHKFSGRTVVGSSTTEGKQQILLSERLQRDEVQRGVFNKQTYREINEISQSLDRSPQLGPLVVSPRKDHRLFPLGFFESSPKKAKRRTIRLNQQMYHVDQTKEVQKECYSLQRFQVYQPQFTFGSEEDDRSTHDNDHVIPATPQKTTRIDINSVSQFVSKTPIKVRSSKMRPISTSLPAQKGNLVESPWLSVRAGEDKNSSNNQLSPQDRKNSGQKPKVRMFLSNRPEPLVNLISKDVNQIQGDKEFMVFYNCHDHRVYQEQRCFSTESKINRKCKGQKKEDFNILPNLINSPIYQMISAKIKPAHGIQFSARTRYGLSGRNIFDQQNL